MAAVVGCRAVPMLLAGRAPNHISLADLGDGASGALRQAAAPR